MNSERTQRKSEVRPCSFDDGAAQHEPAATDAQTRSRLQRAAMADAAGFLVSLDLLDGWRRDASARGNPDSIAVAYAALAIAERLEELSRGVRHLESALAAFQAQGTHGPTGGEPVLAKESDHAP